MTASFLLIIIDIFQQDLSIKIFVIGTVKAIISDFFFNLLKFIQISLFFSKPKTSITTHSFSLITVNNLLRNRTKPQKFWQSVPLKL